MAPVLKEIWLRFIFVLCIGLVGITGCATSTVESPCETDLDCPSGQLCGPASKLCVKIATVDVGDGDPDAGTDDTTSMPDQMSQPDATADVVEDMGTDSTFQELCNPMCPPHQACEDGTCVDACNPGCVAPQLCTANGCVAPECTAVGQACDPDEFDQGAFVCGTVDGAGVCFDKCDDPLAASSCGDGRYCLSVNDTLNVCFYSECANQADCAGGTCALFDNNYGLCIDGGATPLNGACDPAATANACEPGTFCRREPGATTGVCSAVCDLFAGTGCANGEVCSSVLSPRSGLCTVTDATGNAPFDACTTVGAGCAATTQCLSNNFCFKYCRPGGTDCNGVLLGNTQSQCDVYKFPQTREYGICFPPCDPNDADPCGPGDVCVVDTCRTPCTAGNELQDCCDGNTPCSWVCENNFCE